MDFRQSRALYTVLVISLSLFLLMLLYGTDMGRVDQISLHKQNNCHKLCVLVPFRSRFNDLIQFVPHMHTFLTAQKINHSIVVINQQDGHRFNRAGLMNVGFLQKEKECDYFAIHDIDLLPKNPNLTYAYPGNAVFHVSASGLHPKYSYSKFLGGILLISVQNYRKVLKDLSEIPDWHLLHGLTVSEVHFQKQRR